MRSFERGDLRERRMRHGDVRHVVMLQMRDDSRHMIRQERAADAALFPVRAEHEVVDDQLAASVEQIGECFCALRRVERIGLVDLHPRQFAAFAREFVARAHVGFLLGEERPAGREPFLS